MVRQSRASWTSFIPCCKVISRALQKVSLDDFTARINAVQPSLSV